MRRRRLAIVAGLAVLLAFAWGVADSIRPFVTYDRPVIQSTPGLGALDTRTTIPLRRRDEACLRPVILTPSSRIARLRLNAKDPGPALEVTARGGDYSSSTRVDGYGTGSDQVVDATLDPPERKVVGELCVRNLERGAADIVGAEDVRSQVPAGVYLNGELVPGREMELALLEDAGEPLLERPGQLVDRAHAVTGSVVPEWSLWVLLIVVALGFPAAIAGGFALSARAD